MKDGTSRQTKIRSKLLISMYNGETIGRLRCLDSQYIRSVSTVEKRLLNALICLIIDQSTTTFNILRHVPLLTFDVDIAVADKQQFDLSTVLQIG